MVWCKQGALYWGCWCETHPLGPLVLWCPIHQAYRLCKWPWQQVQSMLLLLRRLKQQFLGMPHWGLTRNAQYICISFTSYVPDSTKLVPADYLLPENMTTTCESKLGMWSRWLNLLAVMCVTFLMITLADVTADDSTSASWMPALVFSIFCLEVSFNPPVTPWIWSRSMVVWSFAAIMVFVWVHAFSGIPKAFVCLASWTQSLIPPNCGSGTISFVPLANFLGLPIFTAVE